jgi:hypothetical protein
MEELFKFSAANNMQAKFSASMIRMDSAKPTRLLMEA